MMPHKINVARKLEEEVQRSGWIPASSLAIQSTAVQCAPLIDLRDLETKMGRSKPQHVRCQKARLASATGTDKDQSQAKMPCMGAAGRDRKAESK